MNNYQRGGSVIHDVDTGRGVPKVSYVPTLDLPELKTSPLTSAIDTYVKLREEEFSTAKENLAGITQAYDAVTKVRYDNPTQKDKIEAARERAGLTEDVFTISSEQLKNPYIMGPVSRAVAGFTNDPAIRDIVREQVVFDNTLAQFAKQPPANPVLRDMFVRDVRKYRNGEIGGMDINLEQYADIDVGAVLGKRLSEIPSSEISQLVENDWVTYEERVKQRSEDAVIAVLSEQLQNPTFKNNMIARGFMTDAGTLTDAGEQYVDSLKQAYTERNIEIAGIKNKPSVSKRGFGVDPTPGATAGLTGLDGTLYTGYYNEASKYGIPLDDPSNTTLMLDVLTELKNSAKNTATSTAEDTRKNVTRKIRKEAIRRGNGFRALYDEAVDEGYLGTEEDLGALLALHGGDAAITGNMVDSPTIRKALESLYGPGQETLAWDAVRKSYLGMGQLGTQGIASAAPTARPFTLSSAFLDEPVTTVGDDDPYIEKLRIAEASNNPNAASSTSSARGLGQFLDETWLEVTRNYPEMQGKSNAERLALRTDEAVMMRAIKDLTSLNKKILEAERLTTDHLNLYVLHRFGSSGGKKVLKANRSTPISKVLSPKAIAANPDIKGKTVGQVLAINAAKMGMYTPENFPGSKWYRTWKDIGSGKGDRIDKRVVDLADVASDIAGKKLKIESGHRGHEHNKKVGGDKDSKHKQAIAADLIIAGLSDQKKREVLKALIDNGARGIGFYTDGHIHYDLRPGNKVVTWGTTPNWAKGIV